MNRLEFKWLYIFRNNIKYFTKFALNYRSVYCGEFRNNLYLYSLLASCRLNFGYNLVKVRAGE